MNAAVAPPRENPAGWLARLPCNRVVKWFVVVFWLGAAVAGGTLAQDISEVQENESVNWLPADAESTQVYEISETFQNPNEAPAVVVYVREDGITDADRALVNSHVEEFNAIAGVEDPVEGPFPSEDGKALQLVVPFDMGDKGNGWEKLPDFVDEIYAADVPGDGLFLYVTGPAGFNGDFASAFEGTEGAVLAAAAGVVLIILLLTYRSPWLWVLPMLSALVALAVAMGLVYLLADAGAITLTAQTQVILGILVFGASTDYALLLVARYREELRRHDDRHEAMAFALHRAGPAVFASGATVVVGMLCLAFAVMNSTASMGPVLAIGIGLGLMVMLTLLPALLVIGGRWLFWPVQPKFGTPDRSERSIWAKVGGWIKPRPRSVWIGTTVLLGVATLGVTQIDADGLSYEESFTSVPDSVVGQLVLSEHYPSGAGDPVIVMANADATEEVAQTIEGVEGIVPGSVVVAPPQGELAYLEATLTDPPDQLAAEQTVERLRDALSQVDGADAITGGSTAVLLDTKNAASRDNKVVIPITLVVVFLILIMLLRALVAPLLLLATVVLSFWAAYGISAVVFTHLLGYEGADSGLPLFAFVFLVALGIDYNIFLMTRVREESLRVGTRQGSLIGLTATGAVITSAGLVLAGTFAVMTTIPIVFLVEIGFVVALGVLLDTFIVRSVLVTALNLDIGRHIWWPHRMSRADFVPADLERAPVPEPALAAAAAAVAANGSAPAPRPSEAAPSEPAPAEAAPPEPVPAEPVTSGAGPAEGLPAQAAPNDPAPAVPATPVPPAPPPMPPAPQPTGGSNGTMASVKPHENLLAPPPETRLPEVDAAREMLAAGRDAAEVAAAFPDYSRAWATLADAAYARDAVIESYAYARTGYHRGLDALRRNGWRGHGPVPWEHEPNQGFLRSLYALGRAAAEIGEQDEADRCFTFLAESSAEAAEALAAPKG